MNRDNFRNDVFARDNHKCVMCGEPAVDAHHIIDRSFFEDGGYYLSNGVSLCEKHHIDAETTVISTKELREKANITDIIYPNYLTLTEFIKDYDKWCNPILKTGKRLKGYAFNQDNVQKMLKQGNVLHLFEKEDNLGKPDKYGRTYHFPFSEGTQSDDRISKNYDNVCRGEIIITEKLDGENNLLLTDYGVFTRSRVEPTKNAWSIKMWELFYKIKDDIKGLEVYGESVYAEHSILYSGLKSHFYIFGIKDIETNMWLSWKETEEYAYMLDIPTVPVLFRSDSNFNVNKEELKNIILDIMKTPSVLNNDEFWTTPKEGVVCRLQNQFPNDMFFNSVFKFVRKNHVSTDEHWSRNWKKSYLEEDLKKLTKEKLKERYNFI